MAQGPRILQLADDSPIHKGDARKVKATYTDSADVAATPTDASIVFIPPSGTPVVYAKNPTGGESTLTMSAANIGEVDYIFTEAGWYDVVAYGATNMDEAEPVRIYVENVAS